MSVHDAVWEYRLQLVRLIEGSENKRLACRLAGVHPSTFYRWRRLVTHPRPQAAGSRWPAGRVYAEARVVAVALAYPNFGPVRLAWELEHTLGVRLSAATVWRILRAHRLNTRLRRWLLLEGTPPAVALPARQEGWRPEPGRLEASQPGDLVQMDCFHVGRLKETRLGEGKQRPGVIWQYTAIDVASSFLWAELHASTHNPDPARTSALAYRVARDLRAWGWPLRAVSTDNGNEFRAEGFTRTLAALSVDHRRIRAGRPQSNGKAERVQRTLLEEFWQPALINYQEPSITGLRRDLTDYLTYYNWQRPHTGRWNQGHPPADIIHPDPKLHPPT